MDGDCVANGDNDGENDGDIADDVLKPVIDSWLIGDRGNRLYWFTDPVWLPLPPRVDSNRGAICVSNGGGICFGWCCAILLFVLAPLLPLCNDSVSSFSRAISEKTCASGWYCVRKEKKKQKKTKLIKIGSN